MPRISLIIPVHNGGLTFRRALTALARSTRRPDELIIVADGCSDGSARVARAAGAHVIETPRPAGPAKARNVGAARATGEILVFMDADVAFHATTIDRFEKFLVANEEIAAVFGNYDDAPPVRAPLSRYKNLLQHFVHEQAPEEGFTFWGACGAIRRDVFQEIGGFDESYDKPCIEDIELGYRLRAAGHRIAHRRDILATHLKAWTARSIFISDVTRRAIPWTILIAERGTFDNALNIGRGERVKVALVWMALAMLPFAFVAPWLLIASLVCLIVVLVMNAELLLFLRRKSGVSVMLAGGAWHLFYHWYCGLGFVIGHTVVLSRNVFGDSRSH